MLIGFSGSRRLHAHSCTEYVFPILKSLDLEKDIVVVGDALGVDEAVRRWCSDNKFAHLVFYAHWSKFGKGAGPIRNSRMAPMIERLYAFPGPSSTGTVDMIKRCREFLDESNIIQTLVPR